MIGNMPRGAQITWNDISLRQMIDIKAVIDATDLDDTEKTVELTKIILRDPDVEQLSVPDFSKKAQCVRILEQPVPQLKVLPKKIEIGGRKWTVTRKIDDLTTGQFIDYQTLMKGKIEIGNIGQIVAYLLRPEDGTYGKGYDMTELVEDIENEMSVVEAYAFANFFRSALKK